MITSAFRPVPTYDSAHYTVKRDLALPNDGNDNVPNNKHVGPKSGNTVVKRGNTDGMMEAVIKESVQQLRPRPQGPHDTEAR